MSLTTTASASAESSDDPSARAILIEREIARFTRAWSLKSLPTALKFSRDVERLFNQDTRAGRIRELRITLLIAAGLFVGASFVDPILTPDLGLRSLLVRLEVLPLLLAAALLTPWMGNTVREAFVTATAIVTVIAFETVPLMSKAPFSAFAFWAGPLALVYTNTTVPLRFRSACLASAVCGSVMIVEIFVHEAAHTSLAIAISFQVLMSGVFSLIPSYQIEHQLRLNHLFISREALRASGLAADRDFLATLSNTDGLTGVANRRCFDQAIRTRLLDPDYAGKGVALLMVDVDHFKRYNDLYGHPAGDACLRRVAALLTGALRGGSDLVARYGGEEFTILLFDLDAEQAHAIARRICQAVEAEAIAHLGRGDDVAVVTVSMGMSHGVVTPNLAADMLIAAADQALYAAKRQGRNRVETGYAIAA